MGPKYKVIVTVVLVVLLLSSLVLIHIVSQPKNADYCNKLISILHAQGKTTAQDVFSFEFERAFVFDDCYISGDGFAKRYNLDISIEPVESGVSENIQRIVFVNDEGSFVYEFKCDSNEMLVLEKGIIIYPETVIERVSPVQQEPLIIHFDSSEYYGGQGDSSVVP